MRNVRKFCKSRSDSQSQSQAPVTQNSEFSCCICLAIGMTGTCTGILLYSSRCDACSTPSLSRHAGAKSDLVLQGILPCTSKEYVKFPCSSEQVCTAQHHVCTGTLQGLRSLCSLLNPLGSTVMLYLAAAVSDFFLPWSQMVRAVVGVL